MGLPVPGQQLPGKRRLGEDVIRAEDDEEAAYLLLEDDDQRDESEADELSQDRSQQFHVEHLHTDPVQGIYRQQSDEDVDGDTAAQQMVEFVQ